MLIEERGKSVPQFGSHPVEQKIAQQITTEMKTTEMKLCPRQNLKALPEEYVCPWWRADYSFDHVILGHWQEYSGGLLYDSCQKVAKWGSCNKFCLKKVLEGFDLLEYGDRGQRKECASVRLASSRTKDRAANYNGNEDYWNEIRSLMYMHTFDTRRLAEATEAVVLQMTLPRPGACDSS